MASQNVLKMQQCGHTEPTAHPAGSWRLDAGSAISLRDAKAGVLQIAQGRVWATVDGPHRGAANDLGDVVLNAGERLALAAGQGVVIEPWMAGAAWFSWDALPAAHQAHASRWQAAVAQPLRDLGLALWMAVQALGRLGQGLAGLAEFLVAGRGRVLPRLESNPP